MSELAKLAPGFWLSASVSGRGGFKVVSQQIPFVGRLVATVALGRWLIIGVSRVPDTVTNVVVSSASGVSWRITSGLVAWVPGPVLGIIMSSTNPANRMETVGAKSYAAAVAAG